MRIRMSTSMPMKYLISRMVLCGVFALTSPVDAADPNEEADHVDDAVSELQKNLVGKAPNEIPPVASKHLGGYTDAQRIRGIEVWMNRARGRDRVCVDAWFCQ